MWMSTTLPPATKSHSRQPRFAIGNNKKVSPQTILDRYKEYAPIRELGFNRSSLIDFFSSKPQVVAARLLVIGRSLNYARREWVRQEALPLEKRTRGKILREELTSLGPIFVKMGQTLSQRPDIVGEEACEELSQLQTENEPFDDQVAMYIIAKELQWPGPIAPGVIPVGCPDPEGPPLFAWISDGPIASASLGQVYKARLHRDAVGKYEGVQELMDEARLLNQASRSAADGEQLDDESYLEVAVKVQRPEAVRQIALDWTCSALALEALEFYWRNVRPSGFEASLGDIADEIATGIFQELNYVQEARNAQAFVDSLAFLGFVDAPKCVKGLTTECVLTTGWVRGRHLKDLNEEEGLSLTTMAVEACTASLVLTGYVHADPHEGNLMLDDASGRLVFLDFGLMSNVEAEIMEGFAKGIQACLAEDYDTLSTVFQEVGFVGTPLEWREDEDSLFQVRDLDVFSRELRTAMQNDPDGTSRFGALATVLSALGKEWRMYTPPYVLLLIRTFLTLEGIAAKVDPNFNIYEVSMPWAIKRSLSPSSESGVQTLRQALLTDSNKLQWERLQKLLAEAAAQPPTQTTPSSPPPASAATSDAAAAVVVEDNKAPAVESSAASATTATTAATPAAAAAGKGGGGAAPSKSARGMEAVAALLGSPEGATLRRIAADLDSTDLFLRLVSSDGRPLRRMAAKLMAEKLSSRDTWRSSRLEAWREARRERKLKKLLRAELQQQEQQHQHQGPANPSASASSASFGVKLNAVAKSVGPKTTSSSSSSSSSPSVTTTTDDAAAAATGRVMVPSSPGLKPGFLAMQARRKAWGNKMVAVLIRKHAAKQVAAGWRGAVGVASLTYVLCRISAEACARALATAFSKAAARALSPLGGGGKEKKKKKREEENPSANAAQDQTEPSLA